MSVAAFFATKEYDWDGTVGITAQVTSQGETEEILCWEGDEEEFYLFLPSYAQLHQVRLYANVRDEVYLDGQRLADGMTCEGLSLGVPYDLCYRAQGQEYHFALTLVQSGNVPSLYIDTASGSMEDIHEQKGNGEPGTLRLYTAQGALNHKGNLESVKGRGNSTWNYEKKPYNLTLNSDGDLLGMGAARRWILLANAADDSQLRNKIAYDFARDAGLAYTPESEWVDLYLNGEYAGLYLLCERNEVHGERVAIGQAGSFLVSKDWEWRFRDSGHPFITTRANTALRIHYSDLPEDGLLAIWQSAENAIVAEDGIDPVTGKHWRELIDAESWAKKYLVEEVLGNVDASTLSQFFYYDGTDASGKIYAGPIWDMDLTMKAPAAAWLEKVNQFYGNKPDVWGSSWFYELYHDAEFYSRITVLYETTFRPLLTKLLDGGIEGYYDQIAQAAGMNQLRWGTEDIREAREDVQAYLEKRMAFLDRIWVEQEPYVIVTVNDYGYEKHSFTLSPGTCIPELPVYENDENAVYHGWFYRDTETAFDITEPVREDIEIELRYDILEQPEEVEEIPEEPLTLLRLGPALLFLAMLAAVCAAGLLRCRKAGRPNTKTHSTAG